MMCLTICQPYKEIDSDFGNWIAGFTDGEGCFYIHQTKGSHRCHFRIKLRADDKSALEMICERTGIGYVKDVKPGKKNPNRMAEWLAVSKADCEAIVRLFRQFPLRAKKSRDFELWSLAVELLSEVRHVTDGRSLRHGQGTIRHPNQARIAVIKEQLQSQRKFA